MRNEIQAALKDTHMVTASMKEPPTRRTVQRKQVATGGLPQWA
jgi:hypothetical protein